MYEDTKMGMVINTCKSTDEWKSYWIYEIKYAPHIK